MKSFSISILEIQTWNCWVCSLMTIWVLISMFLIYIWRLQGRQIYCTELLDISQINVALIYIRPSYPLISFHDDAIKWKHFPRYWPFVRGIHRSPVNSPHKGQWRGALMFSLICVWINGWVNNHEAGDLRRYRVHYDVTVMYCVAFCSNRST